MSYFQIAVNIPQINGVFDYHTPPELEGKVASGCLVEVPFGARTAQGVVLRQVESPQVLETRPISALLDTQPVLTAAQLQLAQWLSEETLTPLAVCLTFMLPPGLSQQADTLYQLVAGCEMPPKTSTQQRILETLQKRGALRGRQLAAAFPHQEWKNAAQALVRSGRLRTQPVLPPPAVRPKLVRTVQLAVSPREAQKMYDQVGRASVQQRRIAMLEYLAGEPLPVETTWVFAACGGGMPDLLRLAEMELVILSETEVWRDPLANAAAWQPDTPPQLTTHQQAAWQTISGALQLAFNGQKQPPVLLHGVTGSGKTEIYLRTVEETLQQSRQAIVLVPEISLTPQTVRRFSARFAGQVGVIHSRLSPGERYDTWRRARAGLLKLIIGPRSALFTPLPNPGLIVMDECHDDSYAQSDTQPRYHTLNAAVQYARLTGSLLLLGSATPDVSMLYRAQRQRWTIVKLPLRVLAHREAVRQQALQLGAPPPDLPGEAESASLPLPPVHVTDMRHELQAGNRSIFSRALQEALRATLAAQQQAILYLNRRGSATYVFCRDCGYVLRCPRCDLPLTAHASDGGLHCHTCGYQRQMPKKCPDCGSTRIRQYGAGAERVETELQQLLPEARIIRWDAETTRQKGMHEVLLTHFLNHNADILVGTQMLAKGLDLPLVTLVGIVLADVGLNFPDFRAGERTFQLLTQVAGRAGRSPLGGQVILQTFQPEHYVIRAAAEYDFDGFQRRELEYRQKLGYPPISRLLRMEYRHLKPDQAARAAQSMLAQVQSWIHAEGHRNIEIIGPAPCYFSRLNGYYRWQLLLRGANPAAVLRGKTLENWQIEVDPINVL